MLHVITSAHAHGAAVFQLMECSPTSSIRGVSGRSRILRIWYFFSDTLCTVSALQWDPLMDSSTTAAASRPCLSPRSAFACSLAASCLNRTIASSSACNQRHADTCAAADTSGPVNEAIVSLRDLHTSVGLQRVERKPSFVRARSCAPSWFHGVVSLLFQKEPYNPDTEER